MNDDASELTHASFSRAILGSVRRRLIAGDLRSGQDIAALRHFVGLTQVAFAQALGVRPSTLQSWEQGRRRPEGPALTLLRIVARHPGWLVHDHGRVA